MGRYFAALSGSSWQQGPISTFDTITEARAWAESYGTTADTCTVTGLWRWAPRADHPRRERPIVAVHRRDTSGNGRRWYKAERPEPPIDDGATIDRDPLANLR